MLQRRLAELRPYVTVILPKVLQIHSFDSARASPERTGKVAIKPGPK